MLFRKLHLASIAYNHLVEVVEKSSGYWTRALRMPEKGFVRNTAMMSEGEILRILAHLHRRRERIGTSHSHGPDGRIAFRFLLATHFV